MQPSEADTAPRTAEGQLPHKLVQQKVNLHDERWQRQLLPLMVAMVVAAAILFSVISLYGLRDLYARLDQRPLNELTTSFARFEQTAPESVRNDLPYMRFKTLSLLEADALQRRYQQVNSAMLARVWTRQLGFITGMLLALIGAAFILGKLREATSQLDIEASGWKGSLASSSPGVVLAVIGAILMGMALYIPFNVETFDRATYLAGAAGEAPSRATLPPPKPAEINTQDKVNTEQELFGAPQKQGERK